MATSGVTQVERCERFEYGKTALVAETIGLPPAAAPEHLIFLHGWGTNRESLRGIGVLFQQTRCVHLIDLPGFGDAPPPPEDWDTLQYTDLVQQYMLDRVKGPAVLVGHSFGGRLAVRLASRHLPQIRAVVLMGVPGLPASGFSRRRLRGRGIRLLRTALRTVEPITGNGPLAWHTRRFGSKDYLAAGALRGVLVRTVNENLTEAASTISCPVLLIWGSDDDETPVWLAHRYRELVRGPARLDLLPHKDHHLYAGTGAHLCAYRIKQWLPGLPAHVDA